MSDICTSMYIYKPFRIDPCSKSFYFLSDLVNFGWEGESSVRESLFWSQSSIRMKKMAVLEDWRKQVVHSLRLTFPPFE